MQEERPKKCKIFKKYIHFNGRIPANPKCQPLFFASFDLNPAKQFWTMVVLLLRALSYVNILTK